MQPQIKATGKRKKGTYHSPVTPSHRPLMRSPVMQPSRIISAAACSSIASNAANALLCTYKPEQAVLHEITTARLCAPCAQPFGHATKRPELVAKSVITSCLDNGNEWCRMPIAGRTWMGPRYLPSPRMAVRSRSKTVTSTPFLISASARASPEMPAPAMSTLSGCLTGFWPEPEAAELGLSKVAACVTTLVRDTKLGTLHAMPEATGRWAPQACTEPRCAELLQGTAGALVSRRAVPLAAGKRKLEDNIAPLTAVRTRGRCSAYTASVEREGVTATGNLARAEAKYINRTAGKC